MAAQEGPRGFAVILQQIDDGALHGELGDELQKLVRELGEQSTRFQLCFVCIDRMHAERMAAR